MLFRSTIDPTKRMTAHEALQHPFVAGRQERENEGEESDLLPTVKKNFNARRTLHAAIDTVRAINKLREGQGGMMDGARTKDPERADAQALALAAKKGAQQDSDVDEYERKSDSGYGTSVGSGVTRDSESKDADGDVKMASASVLPVDDKSPAAISGLWQAGR